MFGSSYRMPFHLYRQMSKMRTEAATAQRTWIHDGVRPHILDVKTFPFHEFVLVYWASTVIVNLMLWLNVCVVNLVL